MANPAKAGDAKLWVYRHVPHSGIFSSGQDSQAAEGDPQRLPQAHDAIYQGEIPMASRLTRALTALSLALTFYFAHPSPVQADTSAPVKLHVLKFFLDPALVPDMAYARSVLPTYVADMNAILQKNTSRQLAFDPATDIIITSTKPQSDTAPHPLPTEGFEIWAHAVFTPNFMSTGGFASVDRSGAAAIDGMNWTRLYDPDHLSGTDVRDYTQQVGTMLHELAHVFKAGIGEYYSLTRISDTTNEAPLLDINLDSPGDAFWSNKLDFLSDPLLRRSQASTRSDYLNTVRYASLSAAVLSGDYRNGIPSFSEFTVQVLDQNERPVNGANVRVWGVRPGSPYESQLLFDGTADENGRAVIPWGGTGDPHNLGGLLRLIKGYKDGAPITAPRYVSIYDADIALLVEGESSLLITMRPPNQPPSDISLSNNALPENQPAGSLIGQLTAKDPDARDTLTFSFCGGADDASFLLDGNDLRSAASFNYELKPSYAVCVKADDGRGGVLDRNLSVEVNDAPDTTTVTFTSLGGSDGWVLESARDSNKGGAVNNRGVNFLLGNDATSRRYRSVLAFNTAQLPDDAIITKVTLRMRRQGATGDPLAALGSLVVDVGKPLIGAGAALQMADFQAQAGLASAGVFGEQPDAEGWYSADIGPAAYNLVNLNGATQLRLEFAGKSKTGAAILKLFSGNAAPVNRPVLTVEYELP